MTELGRPMLVLVDRLGHNRAIGDVTQPASPPDASIGPVVPGRPIGPWWRTTGAPKASATGRGREDGARGVRDWTRPERGRGERTELGHIAATCERWTAVNHGDSRFPVAAGQQP
jgi:hypothetical protein